MKTPKSSALHPDSQSIRSQVLRGIAGNRNPGLHFPGYFLGLAWSNIGDSTARVTIADGPHYINASGMVDISALAVLADTALGTAVRLQLEPGIRLATLRMHMQFTGTPAHGKVSATAHLLGSSTGSKLPQWMAAATLMANGQPVCHASGEFAALIPPPGVKLAPLPWEHPELPPIADLKTHDMKPNERLILRACERALSRTSTHASFIEHFWSGVPKRSATGAANNVPIGLQIANRVGHVQGGISLGIAATSACAAAPHSMMLGGISAWYIGPGHGSGLRVRSRVVHKGRTIAVVRTEVKNANGERVLEVVTHHVEKAR